MLGASELKSQASIVDYQIIADSFTDGVELDLIKSCLHSDQKVLDPNWPCAWAMTRSLNGQNVPASQKCCMRTWV